MNAVGSEQNPPITNLPLHDVDRHDRLQPYRDSITGSTVTTESKDTWTSEALQRGDIDAIQQRVLSDPNYLTAQDYFGETPLMAAIGEGHAELVDFLLQQNADPNVQADDCYTCLLAAIDSGEENAVTILQQLIAAGADIHATGLNGWTPLHMAAAHVALDGRARPDWKCCCSFQRM